MALVVKKKKKHANQRRRHERRGFDSWVRKVPWKRAWQPTPVLLPGESHCQRSLAGYSPRGKESMQSKRAGHGCGDLAHTYAMQPSVMSHLYMRFILDEDLTVITANVY